MGTQPLPKKERAPQFLAHVYCGQTAAWIKMPLGTEVCLLPDDIVLDVDPGPPRQRGGRTLTQFLGPYLLWPNGWMHQDATWFVGRPQADEFVLDGDTQHPPPKGA